VILGRTAGRNAAGHAKFQWASALTYWSAYTNNLTIRNTEMPMIRRSNFQSVGWLRDLHTRGLLNMDPPYQRRSVWNQDYKNFFVDTVLRDFPCPAIFLFEKVKPDGRSLFAVVDGKQRLSSLFEFVRGDFPVPDSMSNPEYQGKYFADLPSEAKLPFGDTNFP
jgi:Protein of unknown function DUF262